MPRLRLRTHALRPPAPALLPVRRQRLREFALLPYIRPLPVEDVDGDRDEDGQAGQHRRRPLELELGVPVADVGVEGGRVHGRDAGEEVAGERVAAGRGGGVGSVGGDHVVDRGHVDGVVGGADEHGEDHGGDPVDVVCRSQAGPGEAEEPDRFEGSEVEKPV